jgi:hypothetical protein
MFNRDEMSHQGWADAREEEKGNDAEDPNLEIFETQMLDLWKR